MINDMLRNFSLEVICDKMEAEVVCYINSNGAFVPFCIDWCEVWSDDLSDWVRVDLSKLSDKTRNVLYELARTKFEQEKYIA